jgi:hypothetical protein
LPSSDGQYLRRGAGEARRVVQGWALTDREALAEMEIPAGEAAVEIPDRMIQFFG